MAASSNVAEDVKLGGQFVFKFVSLSARSGLADQAPPSRRIMLGGICFQLFVMIVYLVYGVVWYTKSRTAVSDAIHRLPGGEGIKKAVLGMTVCSIMIIVRGFYRSVELGDGFDGSLAVSSILGAWCKAAQLTLSCPQQNEDLFLLDSIPVAIAMYIIK